MITSVLVGFMIMPVMIRELGMDLYGAWVLSITISSYLMLLDFGVVSALQRQIAANEKNRESLVATVSTGALLLLLVAVLAVLITIVLAFSVKYFVEDPAYSDVLGLLVFIFGIKASLVLPSLISNSLITAKLRVDLVAKVELAKVILRGGGTYYILTNDLGVLPLAMFSAVLDIVSAFVLFKMALGLYEHRLFKKGRIQKQVIWQLIHYGKFVFLNESGQYARLRSDELVISNGAGLSTVSLYAVPNSLFTYSRQLITTMLMGMQTVLTKNFAHDQKNLRKNYLIFTEISALISLFMAINFFCFGDSLMLMWVGDGFFESIGTLYLFAVLILIKGISAPSTSVLFASANHRYLAYWGLVEGFLNIVLSYILLRNMGLIGVVLGSIIASLPFDLVLKPYYACGIVNLDFRVLYKKLLSYILTSTIYFSMVLGISSLYEIRSMITLFLLCFLSAIVGAVFYLKFVLNNEIKQILARGLPDNKLILKLLG